MRCGTTWAARWARLLLVLLLGAACGCGLCRADADLNEAARVLPQRYPEAAAGDAEPTAEAKAPPLSRYWRAFGSPTLDRLVRAALRHNHDLGAAAARVRQAGYGARLAWSDRLPELDLDASVAYSARESQAVTQQRAPGWTTRLGLAASYEVDPWGRMRALHREELAALQKARFSRHAAAMTITAEVTLRWLELRAGRAQLALLDRQDALVARTSALLEGRFKLGRALWTDLLAQRQTARGLQASRAAVRQKLSRARAELRLLLGSASWCGSPCAAAAWSGSSCCPGGPCAATTGSGWWTGKSGWSSGR